jgi:hypothetical protein
MDIGCGGSGLGACPRADAEAVIEGLRSARLRPARLKWEAAGCFVE